MERTMEAGSDKSGRETIGRESAVSRHGRRHGSLFLSLLRILGVLALVYFAIGLARGAVLEVGPSGGFSDIASALAVAAPGDVVELEAGVYAEDVDLAVAGITLRGPNAGISAGVEAGVRGLEAVIEGGIRVTAADVVIEGVAIEGGVEQGGVLYGVWVEADDVVVRQSVIENVGVAPLAVAGSFGIGIDSAAAMFSVVENSLTGNHHGMWIGAGNGGEVSGNVLADNAPGGEGLVVQGREGLLITHNDFSNHGVAAIRVLVGSSEVVARENRFVNNALAVANTAAATVDARRNFWNSGSSAPAENGPNGYSGAVMFSPWYEDSTLETLVAGAGSVVLIAEGETLEAENLVVVAGAEVRVEGGRLAIAELEQQPGGVLEVIDGELVLAVPAGGSHVIAGTFRITHSLGSFEILGDVEFSGSTLGLVSDFHIADGVTLTVTGSLVLDGCRLLGEGSFTVVHNVGAELNMVRCEVEGGSLFLVGSDVRLVDNVFTSSSITVFGTVSGAEIYHNVFADGPGTLAILPGALVTTEVEGWGNVVSVPQASNRLLLRWQEPVLPGRTLESDGRLFVQPGDSVRVDLESGGYTDRVQAIELLLSYHSGYLGLDALNLESPWENELYLLDQPLSLFGKVDAALGFGFAFEDPDGTLSDLTVGDFEFTAAQKEGATVVFFREKDGTDNPMIDTRLTASENGEPFYLLAPFTSNPQNLIIDGTPPVIDPDVAVTQDLGSGAEDVLLPGGEYVREGVVVVEVAAWDELAGLGADGVEVAFLGPGGVELSGDLVATSTVVINGEEFTLYSFELPVDETTPDGLYDVEIIATDRSGNVAVLNAGTIEVARRIIGMEVQQQGLVSTAITRDVTFVCTDADGVILETRTVSVDFVGGTGTAVLAGVPLDTANVSAKMAWTLRKRLPATFDSEGNAEVDFTGANQLRGGDLTDSNFVGTGDLNILSANWFVANTVADITGSGSSTTADYNVLASNWFTGGDPP